MKKIKLTQGKYALVDDTDFEKLNQYKWCVSKKRNKKNWYVIRNSKMINGKRYTILIHRVIMNCPKNKMIDHIDGNSLNNQKKNLRIATNSQNCKNREKNRNNTSGYKGVFWHKKSNKWITDIGVNGKKIHLGLFENPLEAYKAYCEACIKYHGKFANYKIINKIK